MNIYAQRLIKGWAVAALCGIMGLCFFACTPAISLPEPPVEHKRDVIWLRQNALVWAPDSRHLAVATGRDYYIYDQREPRPGGKVAWGVDVLFAAGPTPGSRVEYIASPVTWTGTWVREQSSPGWIRRLSPPRQPVRLARSHDGRWLAGGSFFEARPDVVYLWDLTTGEIGQELTPLVAGVSSLAFNADGQYLAVGRWNSPEVLVWHIHSGQLACPLTGHTDAAHTLDFSPQGNLLATASDDHTVRLWDVSTCQSLAVLTGHQAWVADLAFNPEGTVLASAGADGQVRLWNPQTGELLYQLETTGSWVYDIEFSPDGQRVAAGSETGLYIWDVKTGALQTLEERAPDIYKLAWSPDGKLLTAAFIRDESAINVSFWDFAYGGWRMGLPGFSPEEFLALQEQQETLLAPAP